MTDLHPTSIRNILVEYAGHTEHYELYKINAVNSIIDKNKAIIT